MNVQADVSLEDVSVIAVTNRPGLKGPLIIGTDYAKENILVYFQKCIFEPFAEKYF